MLKCGYIKINKLKMQLRHFFVVFLSVLPTVKFKHFGKMSLKILSTSLSNEKNILFTSQII